MASKKNKPSRRERQRAKQTVQGNLRAKLNKQGFAFKNVQRREIVEKSRKEAEGKILKVLGAISTKLDDILGIFVKDDRREERKEEKKKQEGLVRRWWSKKSSKEKVNALGSMGMAATALAGLTGAMLADDEQQLTGNEDADKPVQDGDEAPPPVPNGVTVMPNGAKLFLGDNVDLDGMNKDFLDRFLKAVKEYQDRGGRIVGVNSAYRTLAEQKRLYEADLRANNGVATKTAEPGTSMHEYGFALDSNTKELDEMDRMGILKKYGLGRTQKHVNKKGKLVETWHLEDLAIQKFKRKLRNEGADSTFSENMRRYMAMTGMPDESLDATVAYIEKMAEQKVATSMGELLEGLQPQAENGIKWVGAAEGGMVNVVAGEAGPELILPLNDRGAEILTKSISSAFREMAGRRRNGRSIDRFSKFFETEFLPELKRRMSN